MPHAAVRTFAPVVDRVGELFASGGSTNNSGHDRKVCVGMLGWACARRHPSHALSCRATDN
jgi:hypothetical protein